MLPFTSLDAATTAGPGVAKDLEGVFGTHFMIVSRGADVALEGSHDGEIWAALATTTQPKPLTAQIVDSPVRFVRANLESNSSNPVTATIASL